MKEPDRRLDPEWDQNPIYTPKREGKHSQPVHMGLPCQGMIAPVASLVEKDCTHLHIAYIVTKTDMTE